MDMIHGTFEHYAFMLDNARKRAKRYGYDFVPNIVYPFNVVEGEHEWIEIIDWLDRSGFNYFSYHLIGSGPRRFICMENDHDAIMFNIRWKH